MLFHQKDFSIPMLLSENLALHRGCGLLILVVAPGMSVFLRLKRRVKTALLLQLISWKINLIAFERGPKRRDLKILKQSELILRFWEARDCPMVPKIWLS